MKTYQAMFIFTNTLPEDGVQEALQFVRGEVEKAGGTVTATDLLGKRAFARPIHKMETGQYARMLLQMPAEAVNPLQARLKLNEKFFRTQVVELKKPAKAAPAQGVPVAAEGGVPHGESK